MAKAERTVVTTESITLTLSVAEAQLMRDVLARVSGDPCGTRREYAANIYNALSGLHLLNVIIADISGWITCTSKDAAN